MKKTRIGCEAYIYTEGKILLGKRGNVHGSGTWALPGGHLEYMERIDECLAREIREEMGIDLDLSKFELLAISDDLQPEDDFHYIHITYKIDIKDNIPKICEPDACEEWRWFETNNLPDNIFPPHQKILATVASSKIYKSAND